MCRRIISSFLLLVGALFLNVATSAAAVKVDGIYYDFSGTSATVTGSTTDLYTGDIVIPSTVTYNGTVYNVTAIAEKAFHTSTCDENINSITIPPSVTTIKSQSVSNITLSRLVLSDGDEPINLAPLTSSSTTDMIFYFRNLTIDELYLGRNFNDSETEEPFITYELGIFGKCKIEKFTIGEKITRLPVYCFNNLLNTRIEIPEGIQELGNKCFANYYKSPYYLAEVVLPSTLTSIGSNIFYTKKKNESYTPIPITLTCTSPNPPEVLLSNFFSDATFRPSSFVLRIPKNLSYIYSSRGWRADIESDPFTAIETFDNEKIYLSFGDKAENDHAELLYPATGDLLTLAIAVDDGWKLSSVVLTDLTAASAVPAQRAEGDAPGTVDWDTEPTNGIYEVRISAISRSARLQYVIEADGATSVNSSIDAAKPQIRIAGDALTVACTEAADVALYDLEGAEIARRRASAGQPTTFSSLARGVYILKAGNHTFKIHL